ncbi:SxtJ family membrane protein [Bacteriovorax stolpii]|uniref:SxtJ family membrane protein n=1 Tax=Bacteriovorax stolpii TaxID=960 RepID=UPI00105FEE96|nr:SxtJ family membrane protein [Bacteriovorax stolpii]
MGLVLETPVYILGLAYGWEKSGAVLLKDGRVVVNFSESHFSHLKDDYSFPKESVRACLKKEAITLKDVSYIGFYDKPLLKFERVMKDIIFKVPFSFLRFMKTTKEWISEGKMLFKNQMSEELMKLYPNEKVPEILFSEMPVTKELLNIHLSKHLNAYDFGAACAVWELHLKHTIPADNFQAYEHFEDQHFEPIKKLSLDPFLPNQGQLEKGELRKFGIVMGLLILGLFGFAIPYLKHTPHSYWPMVWGPLLMILGLLTPEWLKRPYVVWMVIAKIVGKIKSWGFYTVLYFLILCPYALVARVFFRKALREEKAVDKHTLNMKSIF